MSIIRLRNVAKSFGDRVVFRGVDLDIAEGAFAVIQGESGAGKSTLLNIIGGLESADGGEVVVDSQDVMKLSAKERTYFYRNEVGIIFQGSYLQPQLSLLDNIMLPGVFAGLKSAERKARAYELAGKLGIVDVLEQLPQAVSGGQAERACIARALLLKPKIILADEPTSNLDPSNAKAVLEILNSLRIDAKLTVVMVSHNVEALAFASQVIVVAGGEVQDRSTAFIENGRVGVGGGTGSGLAIASDADGNLNVDVVNDFSGNL